MTTETTTTPKLMRDERGLALVDGDVVARADFTRMLPRLKPANLNRELLVRAAKVKHAEDPLTAFDATAGLGEDALLLAAAGFNVRMYERNPTIAALLRDALERAAKADGLAGIVCRMQLVEGDSVHELPRAQEPPDVVLLDPMFPAKHKSSVAKKKLRMLQRIEDPCDDEQALLGAALSARPHKVVIKRPVKGPHLAGRKPDYTLTGKAIRYDVIVLPRPAN